MKINSDNYIDFFVRYYDKELSTEETGNLFRFLDKNPDLEKEFYDFLSVSPLSETEIGEPFLNKHFLLKKSVDAFELKCIDFIENQQTDEEEEFFLRTIQQDSEKEKTFQFFLSTVLQADDNLKFQKKTIAPYFKRKVMTYSLSIAAGLLLFVSLGYTLKFYTPQKNIIPSENLSAKVKQPEPEKPITVTKVLRPKILAQTNVEETKNKVNNNVFQQAATHKKLPIIEKIRKIKPKPFNQVAIASLTLPDIFSKPNLSERIEPNPRKGNKPKNNKKTLKDLAFQKINQISNNHIQIKTDKNQPKKVDEISIKTNKFTFKKY